MDIQINELAPCKLEVTYIADAEEILNKRAEVLETFKKAPVPGFRPNKAPLDAIKVHYRNQIEESLKRALAENSYHNTIFEKKLKPHGLPKFNSLLLINGKFTCEFELHTRPDFELADFSHLEVPKPHQINNPIEVTEQVLQELRLKFGEMAPYTETDFVQSGDNIILDYEGTIDGQKIDQLSATAAMVNVGTGNLKDFDTNLLGMNLGETREFDLLIPDNALPSLGGKTAQMKVTLNMGSKITPCPLDDTLAQKTGRTSFQELKELVRANAEASLQKQEQSAILNAVSNNLIALHTFSVPAWMSLSEAQYLAHSSKVDWNTLSDQDKERYLEMAEKNVKLSLILDKIREEHPEAQLSEQEVFDIIKQNVDNVKTETSFNEVIQQMNRTGYLPILMARIKDEYAMDFVMKTVKIVE